MSLIVSFVLSFYPLDVLDKIWDLIESVSEDFPTYFFIPSMRFIPYEGDAQLLKQAPGRIVDVKEYILARRG